MGSISILDSDVLCGYGRGSDLVEWAKKVRCLGDMIQAVHQSRYPEMGFDPDGTIGSIVADYGRLIGAYAEKIEGDVTELWKKNKDSNVRLFKSDYEYFKARWKHGVPVDEHHAKRLYDEVDSYIDQHDPSSLYEIREELAVFIKNSAGRLENQTDGGH